MALIQITAYVRNQEDLAKWKALSNKTKWLHERLNPNLLTEIELNKQFNQAGGKEVITEVAVSNIDVAKKILNDLDEPTIIPPEEPA